MDWGFSSDEYAYIRISVDNRKKIIYICNEIYQTGLTLAQTANYIKSLVRDDTVYCDSAEPRSIYEYNEYHNINAIGVKKFQNSRRASIEYIKEYEILIHPNCVNFHNEIMQYRYKQDKDGRTLPEVVEKEDHLIDALRYAVMSDIKYDMKDDRQTASMKLHKKLAQSIKTRNIHNYR